MSDSVSSSISLGPQAGNSVMLLPVLFELSGNASYQRIGRVAVAKEGGDAEQYRGQGQGGGPVFLQDVQANNALGVYVAMVDSCKEGDLGRLEWILRREVDV